jgi:hypothetical protein
MTFRYLLFLAAKAVSRRCMIPQGLGFHCTGTGASTLICMASICPGWLLSLLSGPAARTVFPPWIYISLRMPRPATTFTSTPTTDFLCRQQA